MKVWKKSLPHFNQYHFVSHTFRAKFETGRHLAPTKNGSVHSKDEFQHKFMLFCYRFTADNGLLTAQHHLFYSASSNC